MNNVNEQLKIEQFSKIISDLQKFGKKILDLKDQFEQLELDMLDPVNFAAKLFAMRQFDQLEAMFLLSDNENIILISRSMFEGAVYIGCFCADNSTMAKDWRNYGLVVDQKRVDNDERPPDEVVEFLNKNKDKIASFKKPNGKFYHSWTKGASVKQLSLIAKLNEFYDKYYSPMSDFHHWGIKSFGVRYECLQRNVNRLNTAEIKQDGLNAWCISISSIINVLGVLSHRAENLELKNKISKLKNDLSNLDGLKNTEIKYSQNA